MQKVYMTIRKGRTIVKKGSVDFKQVINVLIDITQGAHAPIQARARLNNGETYKYKHKGFNVTLTPIYGVEY